MSDIKIKWLIYTVLIGLVPCFIRLSLAISTNTITSMVSISDLVAFALVMQISTIGGCEQLNAKHSSFKSFSNGLSIILLILSGLYYALSLLLESKPDLINLNSCLYILAVVCLASTSLSYATHDRIYKDTLISEEI